MAYSFGKSSFSTFLWINNGADFSDVKLVEIEMLNGGAFELQVIKDGKIISSSERANEHGGWSTFSFSSGMNPPVHNSQSPYKLKFVNKASGERQVKQGQVTP